jgi:hypothetical protein
VSNEPGPRKNTEMARYSSSKSKFFMEKNYKKFHDCFVTFLKRVKKFPAINLISNKFTHLNQAHCDHLSGSLRQPIIILGIQLSPILIVNIQNKTGYPGDFQCLHDNGAGK